MWPMALSLQRMGNRAVRVTTELFGIMCWKSELRVVAVKSGNADGAKARRIQDSETVNKDRTPSRENP